MAVKTKASPRQVASRGIVQSDDEAHIEFGRERVIEIQRTRLLSALLEVSAERGAGNVAVAHVVERAGVSRRTFYELFTDREECFLAAFDDAFARASRRVLDAYDAEARWAERIRGALVALLEFLDAERGAGQLLIVGSLGAGHRALERRQRGIAQIIAVIDEGRKESKAGAELPPLTAEGIVGGALSVLHSRLLEDDHGSRGDRSPMVDLAGALMSMIVLPYLGPAAARKEFARPVSRRHVAARVAPGDPLREVGMRLTYRTVRVLMSLASNPGASNREIGIGAGMEDQGQISKLLARLQRLDLIHNARSAAARGAPNAWGLTERGWSVQRAMARQSTRE
jgi:AcrR family transcriptional regulator/DNA-binding MarR family transcriptional regulator